MTKIALILGYGPKDFNAGQSFSEIKTNTPYGDTSGTISHGKINNNDIYVLQRHGNDKTIPSFMVNFKANIFALYEIGCEYIIATSVCGSLREEICPGEIVIFDQFINLSTHRELTFTDKLDIEKLNHSALHKPFSDEIRDCLIESCVKLGITTHTKGSVLAVDGPRQSTRAESNLYRQWGADVINTTTAPEAILAHELQIKYASLSLCTFYDSWRTDIAPALRAEKQQLIDSNGNMLLQVINTAISVLCNN
ncbi:MAG: MTAP family purine nucleoside phosphorylase [Bacteroidales bacterium]|nr:MTAP family purine nucleoside phosphorylase [Bacteroidales bacterium]